MRLAERPAPPASEVIGRLHPPEVVVDEAGLLALRPEWDALHEAADFAGGPSFNPFMQWSWTWSWWLANSRAKRSLRQPRYRLHVLVFRDSRGTARAILPLVEARWGVGRVALRALRLFGFGPCTTDLRAPIVATGWEGSAADAIARHLAENPGGNDIIILDGLAAGDQLTNRLSDWARSEGWSWGPAVPSHLVDLPPDWRTFRSGLRGHIRKSVRHGYNSLARDGHTWQFEVVDDVPQLDDVLSAFFRLHAARSSRRVRPRHTNYYAREADRETLRLVARELAPEGRFAAARLRVDGRVVAIRLVLLGQDVVYLHDAGAENDWSKYAVATTLTAECLRWAIERGARWAHLGTGIDPSKTRWQGKIRQLHRLQIVAPTASGRALVAASYLPRLARGFSLVTAPFLALEAEGLAELALPWF